MKKFIGFTKIGQFRQVVGEVKRAAQYQGVDEDGDVIMNRAADLPTLKFKSTVKLHGTNAGVAMDSEGEFWAQSRKGVITIQKDNAGFAFFAESRKSLFTDMIMTIRKENDITDGTVVIFGEFCGSNIQKGVAINGLEKMFVIFAVKVATPDEEESNYYLHEDKWDTLKSPENNIYNINDYESHTIEIDFDNPDMSRNEMIDIMAGVEAECPVGKAFGRVSGEDDTTGEGNVWVGWVGRVEKNGKGVYVNGYHASIGLTKELNNLDNGVYTFSP